MGAWLLPGEENVEIWRTKLYFIRHLCRGEKLILCIIYKLDEMK